MNAFPPRFKTIECADILGVSTDFILDEIKDGRLPAVKTQRGQRTIYRIELPAFKDYCEKFWPNVKVQAA